ncbi:MAG: KOW domain-containing RNA-binding protein [Lachnospiraceae bacterium]|nr:KOW domain-containing RNA-binding protein [Lachnospiraceae bacterium]
METGHLARSLAGRDKGRLSVILAADDEYVSLADGRNHTVEKPKRKKKKHVQLQYLKGEELQLKRKQMEAVTDEEIREFLELHQQGGKINVEGRRN